MGTAEGERAMSHEGIRIVSQEQARREDAEHEEMPSSSITPAKVLVKKTEGTGVEIEWKDGHKSAWNFVWLRNACPCATCHEDRENTGRLPGEAKAKDQTLLKLYEAPVKPLEVTPVGKYAIRFKWNDGHESGIYSWEYLRRVCRCDDCMTKQRL
jgi:DUF971 family protein